MVTAAVVTAAVATAAVIVVAAVVADVAAQSGDKSLHSWFRRRRQPKLNPVSERSVFYQMNSRFIPLLHLFSTACLLLLSCLQ